jgi:hypothetical protein
MAGFGKVVYQGEYFNQKVVNILWYRSAAWLPGQGNPFDDVSAFLASVDTTVTVPLCNCLPDDYKLATIEGVGYDDSFQIITPSPVIYTVSQTGNRVSLASNGAAPCAIIDLRCGAQVPINGLGTSKRDRGYVAIGPMCDADIDDYSHVVPAEVTLLETLAANLMLPIVIVNPAVTLQPIRIHQKFHTILGVKTLAWRTYSDVLGYGVRRLAAVRRSRFPEA